MRILIAEDELILAYVMRTVAPNGSDAVARCGEPNPETIATAYADDETVVRAEAAGAMSFLSGPHSDEDRRPS